MSNRGPLGLPLMIGMIAVFMTCAAVALWHHDVVDAVIYALILGVIAWAVIAVLLQEKKQRDRHE